MRYAFALTDLARLGASAEALDGVPLAAQDSALRASSAWAEGYLRQRFALPLIWVFATLSQRATDGAGEVFDTNDAGELRLALDVTTMGAGVTLSARVEHSDDEAGPFTTLASFEDVEAAALPEGGVHLSLSASGAKRYVRAAWTLDGAASFAITWDGDDLKRAICAHATYDILSVRGLDPEIARDKVYQDRAKEALAWLSAVAAGRVLPCFLDSTPQVEEGTVYTRSRKKRGWL